jgi:hypothetical protein
MENNMADEIQQDDDYRQGAEHNQLELEFQEWLLSKKQAENTSTLKSIGYKNPLENQVFNRA